MPSKGLEIHTYRLLAAKNMLDANCCPKSSQDAKLDVILDANNCCPKSSQDVAVLAALKAVQDTEKNHLAHKEQVQRLIPIILPLSLVRRLVGELDHPDPGAKLNELDPPKGLGGQIRKLVLGVDVARLEVPFLQAASDEVAPHPDVLAPFMENMVLCQC
jgi:hypothetical protein